MTAPPARGHLPSDVESFVCWRCVHDEDLQNFIRRTACARECDYCGRTTRRRRIAVELTDLADEIKDGLLSEWGDALDEGVPYESAEGGWQLATFTSWELLEEIGLSVASDDIIRDIAKHLPDLTWSERDPFLLRPHEALRYGWEKFSNQVKHKTRYLFFDAPKNDAFTHADDVRPEEMLDSIGNVITEVGLVHVIPRGTELVRSRIHERGLVFTEIKDLGSPPVDKTKSSNRMSPAGISMFYSATDEATALAETYDSAMGQKEATLARFRVRRDLRIVDFANLPPVPGLFSRSDRHLRTGLRFLHEFVDDLSKPITRDGREHFEYAPTQVVTEYLRYRFRDGRRRVHGLSYPSSQRGGGVNVTLFLSNEDLVGTTWRRPARSLRLLKSKLKRLILP